MGRKRSGKSIGGQSEQENTLNQLLVEMDGEFSFFCIIFFIQSTCLILKRYHFIDMVEKKILCGKCEEHTQSTPGRDGR